MGSVYGKNSHEIGLHTKIILENALWIRYNIL